MPVGSLIHDLAGDFDLHAENRYPGGITHAHGRFYVVDWFDRRVYAYIGTGQHIASTEMPEDSEPRLPSGSGPSNRTYTVGTTIDPVTLPVPRGGDGTRTYSLAPQVPGLTFNPTTRRLSGTPSSAGTFAMTYTVTDADADTDTLNFIIKVEASDDDRSVAETFDLKPEDPSNFYISGIVYANGRF